MYPPPPKKVPLIIDTDASFDVDDVLAICMAHALERRGEAKILAVMHDAGIPEGRFMFRTLLKSDILKFPWSSGRSLGLKSGNSSRFSQM